MTGLLPRISGGTSFLLVALLFLFAFAKPTYAFGAGNIASIARIEGRNFRHGDIEDAIKNLAFLGGAKWSAMNIRRVYFGNWLRDYSQALDVGTIQKAQPSTIRVIVWVLAFMSFGYATGEFEVTEERLGVYRPEEHIDNPKDYADNTDARAYEPRLRPPVHPHELAIDPNTAMKNYIANEAGGWATSSGYVKHSLNRSIYYGRKYVAEGVEADLCEALRCLGQALHTMEDFSAHSNYVELALIELGFHDVYPHVGVYTQIQTYSGKVVWPLVTGTFGAIDFYHSVLGEAQDKFTQSEIDEVNQTLGEAHQADHGGNECSTLRALLSQIPETSNLANDAQKLEDEATAREMQNVHIDPSQYGSRAAVGSGGFDPEKTIRDIYPILEFRDKVMRAIENAIEQIPGLMAIVERISESLTIFIMSLLAPYVQPLISRATVELQAGSSALIGSSADHQWEVWTDPYSSDPTHSMLSKDHFSNILNNPAGQIAYAVVEYVVPRVLYAFEHPNVPVQQVLDDVSAVFHHPSLRNPNHELQTTMFATVQKWTEGLPDGGASLNAVLNSEAVKAGRNHTNGEIGGGAHGGHGKCSNGEWAKAEKVKKGKKGKKQDTFNIGGMSIPIPAEALGGGKSGKNADLFGGALPGVLGSVLQGFAEGQGSGKKKKEKKDKYDEADYADYKDGDEKKKKKKKDKYGEADYADYADYDDDKKKKKKKDKYDDDSNPGDYKEEKKKKKKDKYDDAYDSADYKEEKKKKKKDKYGSEEEDDGYDKKKKKEYRYDEYGNKIKVESKDKDKKKKKKKDRDGDSEDEGKQYSHPGAFPGSYERHGHYESHGHHGHHSGGEYYGSGYGRY